MRIFYFKILYVLYEDINSIGQCSILVAIKILALSVWDPETSFSFQ